MKPEQRRDPHAPSSTRRRPRVRRLGENRTGHWSIASGPEGPTTLLHTLSSDRVTPEARGRFRDRRDGWRGLVHPGLVAPRDAIDEGETIVLLHGPTDGETIGAFCDRERVDWIDRIQLVEKACAIVQASHDRSVVHHALAPVNVLVSGPRDHRQVEVTGFGIAPALFGDGTTPRIQASTPLDAWAEFLAPEQTGSADLPLDSRADVYALAVLSYRLLVGAAPHDLETIQRSSKMGMLDWMYRDEPLPASARLSLLGNRADAIAEARGTTRHALERALRGELDAILTRALMRDPDARTDSPSAFAQELRAYRERVLHEGRGIVGFWRTLRRETLASVRQFSGRDAWSDAAAD